MSLIDRNGDTQECLAEAFTQKYQIFILIHAKKTLTAKSVIIPAVSFTDLPAPTATL